MKLSAVAIIFAAFKEAIAFTIETVFCRAKSSTALGCANDVLTPTTSNFNIKKTALVEQTRTPRSWG
jgi:hypothetical protein